MGKVVVIFGPIVGILQRLANSYACKLCWQIVVKFQQLAQKLQPLFQYFKIRLDQFAVSNNLQAKN